MRDFMQPGRSSVQAPSGMVATSHPLSTSAGLAVLQAGGNAVDAAVTAAAVQTVVEPQSTGLGGDGFALVAPMGRAPIFGLNASGRAPQAASAEVLLRQGLTEIPRQSAHAVTVPGMVDGWQRLLTRFGSWSLGDCLAPAIAYARDGFPVHARVHHDWKSEEDLLRGDAFTRSHMLVADEAPHPGTRMRFPHLAATLETLATEGAQAFYQGALAEAMVARLKELGGLHTMADFAATEASWVDPISTDYQGHRVWQIPPNGQGLVALIMLNILEGFETEGLDAQSAMHLHRLIEAARWGYGLRDRHIGETSDRALDWLLSKDFAAECRAQIADFQASPDLPRVSPFSDGQDVPHHDTVYISVVDKDRTCVSLINSVFHSFGSGLACPKTGIVFQNRGQSFRLTPGHPNALAGGKRPMHTIIPGMVTRGPRVSHCYGVMGGQYQPFGHAQVLTAMLDFGLDPQAALDLPRVMAAASGPVEVESGISADTKAKLETLGHTTTQPQGPIGGGQIIALNWDQDLLIAGSDPRKDGQAAGY